jgi:mitogen-activated protein kinase kinase 9
VPGAIAVLTYQVAIGFVAAEPIEAFTNARLASISISVAAESGVDPSAVTTVAYAGSTRVEITIVTTDSSASAAIEETLSTSVFADANAASEFFNLQVTTAPTIAVETVTRLVPPEINAGLTAPIESSTNLTIIIAAVVCGGLGLIAILCFCFYRYRGKGKARRAAKRGGWNRVNPISSMRSQPSRSKPPRSPSPKGSGTEMSSMVGSSMHVVNLVRWEDLTLKESLGAGSFGEVRVTVWNSTPCAIKSLRATTAPAALQELLNEFELTMRLHHPNVLLTMGIAHDADDGKTGILMELMPASLLDVLHHHRQRDQLTRWEASLVLIALDVAKGMTYLHAMDVVHRDLKPGNVLLTEHWVAKVADFGTALIKNAGQAEGPAGTPPYMAPEAFALTVSAKAKPTDVWSFGCLLTHMGTRSVPFSHVPLPVGMSPKDAVRALVAIIVGGQATPLDQLRNMAGCPPGILGLTTRCLHNDPVQRPTFPSIVDELQRIKGSVRASRPSTPLRRTHAIRQTGAAAAPTFISATCCASTYTSANSIAPTYTSATYCASTGTSATHSAPTYSSETLKEGWNSQGEPGIGGSAPVVMPHLGEDLVGSMLQEADIANFFSEFQAELDA